jgi:hypothetical protein
MLDDRGKAMDNYGVTLTQYLDPIWRDAFMRETGFVDVLSLDTAKSRCGITQRDGNLDTHKPERI